MFKGRISLNKHSLHSSLLSSYSLPALDLLFAFWLNWHKKLKQRFFFKKGLILCFSTIIFDDSCFYISIENHLIPFTYLLCSMNKLLLIIPHIRIRRLLPTFVYFVLYSHKFHGIDNAYFVGSWSFFPILARFDSNHWLYNIR